MSAITISDDENIIKVDNVIYKTELIDGRKPFQFSESCSKCPFYDTDECDMVPCIPQTRKDKKDVQFVQVDVQNLPEVEKCTNTELNIRMHSHYPELGLNNYCEDYYSAMRLAFQNNLWIQPDMVGDKNWHVYDCDDRVTAKDPNPLRAVTMALIKLKEQDQ